jgi:hypothetical protein
VLGHGLKERRHGLRSRCPPHGSRGRGTRVVVQVAELVDRAFELLGRDGLRRGRFLRAKETFTTKDTKDTED